MLAEQLRIRGIVPWVDKQGGFQVGDRNVQEARRAIQEDCLGCLLYATPAVFERRFITEVEMPAAVEQHARDANYLLFAVPRGLDFAELATKSMEAFGLNLADHHCIPVKEETVPESLANVARETLTKLICGHHVESRRVIRLQYSTRELFPSGDDELLCVDGRNIYREDGCVLWDNLVSGLCDVKRVISSAFGRPQIIVEGSKHLSAAFLFGRVFQPFDLSVRHTSAEYWETTGPLTELDLDTSFLIARSEELVVTVATGDKNLQAKALEAVGRGDVSQLSITPRNGRFTVGAASSRWLAKAVYEHIDKAVSRTSPKKIHLFMAIPQTTAMQLGQKFAGMPKTLVYDWNGTDYEAGKMIPGGVL